VLASESQALARNKSGRKEPDLMGGTHET
jgi:hypothetical protein